jgi:hypothetical protein
MKVLFSCLLAITSLFSFAQKKNFPNEFAKTITTDDLKKHLEIIAGKEMEGRETGTEGQRKASSYIENHFRNLGLLPGNKGSYQFYYKLYQDSLIDTRLEVNDQPFELDKDFNPATSNITSTLRFSEIMILGRNAADSLNNLDLNGRLVLMPATTSTTLRVNTISLEMLRKKGVAAILWVSNNYPGTTPAARKQREKLDGFQPAILPQQFYISEKVARSFINDYSQVKSLNTIARKYKADLLLEVKKQTKSLQSSNVIAILEGSDLKDEYLLLTAHYDHLGKNDSAIYYGADDDGSGTVSILELAEAFAKAKAAGKGPRRSIVFMTVSGEEKGLLGSEYYAEHATIPLEKITANLNIDMIGRSDPKRSYGDSLNYVYIVGDDKLSSDLRTISEAINKKYIRLELDYKYNDPNDQEQIYYRSDHYNFAKNGVPIIFYFNGTHADYHKPTDTPDKINYKLMSKRAQLVFYTAWEMANRNEMLKRDLPLPELKR